MCVMRSVMCDEHNKCSVHMIIKSDERSVMCDEHNKCSVHMIIKSDVRNE